MNVIDVSALSGFSAVSLVAQAPRAVDATSTQQFRDLMSSSACDPSQSTCQAQSTTQTDLHKLMDFDIEKLLASNMPAANASPAEFAMGLLRAQIKVSQAAVAIEMVSKTTQSLSQGVQSLTSRS